VMTVAAISMGLDVRRVGDIGEITRSLPVFHIPNISFSLETLEIILPYSLALAVVGLLESLLTAALVDDLTDTRSSKDQEARGQGIANIVTGFLGGMAGCGMVGQSIINVRSGGRGRLSTCISGVFLLFAIFVLRDIVQQIPVAALLGIMIMVAFETFDWKSLKTLRRMPLSEALVMPVTVAIVVWTHDLSKGVLAGLIMSVLVFGWQAAQIKAQSRIRQDGVKVYDLQGQLFFGSVAHFVGLFDYNRDPDQVMINFSQAHVWDHSGAEAIAKVIHRYHRIDKRVTLMELNSESHACVSRLGLEEQILHINHSAQQVA
jgi:sulfate permease, SulP family